MNFNSSYSASVSIPSYYKQVFVINKNPEDTPRNIPRSGKVDVVNNGVLVLATVDVTPDVPVVDSPSVVEPVGSPVDTLGPVREEVVGVSVFVIPGVLEGEVTGVVLTVVSGDAVEAVDDLSVVVSTDPGDEEYVCSVDTDVGLEVSLTVVTRAVLVGADSVSKRSQVDVDV